MLIDSDKETVVLHRATRAEKLLKDDLLKEAFELVKKALMQKWEASPVRDKEGREYLFLMIKATNDARGYLEQAIRDGKVEVHSKEQRRLFGLMR